MFDNLTAEIFYYSVIPVLIITLVIALLFIFSKKDEKGLFKLSYVIKILLIAIIALVLPLINGYTTWITERYVNKGTLLANVGYIAILGVLTTALIALLSIVCLKLRRLLSKEKTLI